MDDGQPINPNQAPFFTAGVGNVHEGVNPDAAKSLNENAYTSEHDTRGVGSSAITSSNQESYGNQSNIIEFPRRANYESLQNTSENFESEELGKIIPMMPPGMEETDNVKPEDSINVPVIRTNKKTLEKAGVREVNRVILEFNQTGNAAKLYDSARRGMTKINLKNSFDRELAA